jgi:hypothetical protein
MLLPMVVFVMGFEKLQRHFVDYFSIPRLEIVAHHHFVGSNRY